MELSGGFPVGDIRMLDDVTSLSTLVPAWARFDGIYSGRAVAFRSADSDAWGPDCEAFVIIAEDLEWRPGPDWKDVLLR